MASTVQPATDAETSGETGRQLPRFLNLVARLSLAALLVSIAIALVAGVGTRLRLWDYETGLLEIFPYGLYAGVAAFVLGFSWMAAAFFSATGTGARYAVTAVLGSIAVLWMPLHDLYLERLAHAIPPLHDISTDTEHAPEFIALRERGPARIAAQGYDGARRVKFEGRTYATQALQKLYYGDLRAYGTLTITPPKLLVYALKVAATMGWTIVAVEPDNGGGQIEATDTTLLFGLTDDIVIRVRPAGKGAWLDIRSRSRADMSDFGRNAARIRAYLKKLATG